MKNYICINDVKTELTDKQGGKVRKLLELKERRLSEVPVGQTVRIGDHVMIALEHSGDTTAVICKEPYRKDVPFGKNNNYNGSNVDKICEKFADELAAIVGEENIVMHTVDLTTDDGLKDYGKIRRRASAMTTDQYRRYVDILDEYKLDIWTWLATAFSTKKHDSDRLVKCVSPSGCVLSSNYVDGDRGVRPFCILKSNIFVS